MILWNTPRIVRWLYPGLVWNVETGKRSINLTFDDGPSVDITNAVLEILSRHQAQVTFFCTGRNVERNPGIFNTITRSGHTIGNHTYSHIKGWNTCNAEYYADVELASRFIPSLLFRPPYGKIKPAQARYLRQHYTIVMWSLLSYDFHPEMTKDKCLRYVIKNTKPGSIVVFHDSPKAAKNMLYTLPRMLDHFRERGFTFNALSAKTQASIANHSHASKSTDENK